MGVSCPASQNLKSAASGKLSLRGAAELGKNETANVGGVSQRPCLAQGLGLFRAGRHCPRFIQCGLGLGIQIVVLVPGCLAAMGRI
jgi:hypothetical protein